MFNIRIKRYLEPGNPGLFSFGKIDFVNIGFDQERKNLENVTL
jgi:hypothetical protein